VYSANHVMTTTAATSMISKKSTTAASLAAGAQRFSAAVVAQIFDTYFGQNAFAAARMSTLASFLLKPLDPRQFRAAAQEVSTSWTETANFAAFSQ
jgi:hypothetical protein